MGLRGETVGTAYVRILADGTFLDRSIKDELEGHDETFKSAGRDDQVNYRKGWDDESEKAKPLDTLYKKLLQARGRFDRIGHLHGSDYIESVIDAMKRGFNDDVGERLGIKLREGLRRTMDTDFIEKFIDNIGVHVDQVTREIIADENRAIEKFKTDFKQAMADLDRTHGRTTKDIQDRQRTLDRVFDQSGDAIEKFVREGKGDIEKVRAAFVKNFEDMHTETKKVDRDFNRLSRVMLQFSDIAGTAFGRGSRNNFLNFFGSVVRNVSSLAGRFVRAGEAVFKFVTNFQNATSQGMSFGEMALNLGKGLGVVALGFTSLAIAGTLVVLVVGPMAALISGLTAALVALAGSLAYAASAGFGALLGAMLPVVAAFAGIILAVKGLDKAMKKDLAKAFEPLVDIFDRFSKIAASNIFDPLIRAAPIITEAFRNMEPIIDGVTESLGKIPNMFTRILQSPAWIKFNRQMGVFLPQAVEDLGKIFANTFKGMLGLLRSVLPITDDFLGWLKDLTQRFADFTNSTKGQKQLKKFFDDAADSAKAVGRFVDKLFTAIGKLLKAGRGSGDTIFDDMSDALERFIQFLDDNPDAVKDFFKNGVETMRSIGHLLEDIIELFDTLDSEENRENLQKTLALIGHVVDAISFTFGVLERMIDNVKKKFSEMGDLLAGIWDGADAATLWLHNRLNDIGKWFRDAWNYIKRITDISWTDIVHSITKPFQDAWDFLFGHSVVPDMVKGFEKAWNTIKRITKEAFDFIADHTYRPIFDAYNRLKNLLGNVVDMFSDKFGDLKNTVRDAMNDIFGFVQQLPGRLRNLAGHFRSAGAWVIEAFLKGVSSAGNFALDFATNVWEVLKEMINDAIDKINDALEFGIHKGPIDIDINVKDIPHLASGGILRDKRFIVAGEDGPEAVVPLNRPLSQVDPAVRELSAIAQGLRPVGQGKTVDVGGITIITPTEDPRAVATETINTLTGAYA